jgi:transcription antitermination factor NusG
MMMGKIEAADMRWFAVRVKRRQAGAVRAITIGGEFEVYRDRKGQLRQRRVSGTGERVFLPEHILRRAGFEVFLPVKKEWRRKNRFTPEKQLVSYPLLVDWLFVGWPAGQNRWPDLMALDVVVGVMGTGGHPVEIPPARIMRLMRQWGGGKYAAGMERRSRQRPIKVGDHMRIMDGPFEGVSVRVVEVSGPTVKALAEMLGGDIRVDLAADVLERRDP